MKLLTTEKKYDGRKTYRLVGIKIHTIKPRSGKTRRCDRTGKPVLVIRLPLLGVGLLAHYAANLGWIKWAKEKGYLAYVDMRTPVNTINHGKPIAFNPWDSWFEQHCGIQDMLCARSIRETGGNYIPGHWPHLDFDMLSEDSVKLREWRRFAHENMIFSRNMAQHVDERHEQLFGGETRVLGCLVRGTDYISMKPHGHPVQPDAATVIGDARRLCAERGLKKVFLATEDNAVRRQFQEAFGDSLIINQTNLPDYRSGYLIQSGALGDTEKSMDVSTQYLTSVALLARCPCLLTGCVSGAMGAVLMSDGFEYLHAYNLGFYP